MRLFLLRLVAGAGALASESCDVGRPERAAPPPEAVRAVAARLLGAGATRFFGGSVVTRVTSPRYGAVSIASGRRDHVEWGLWCKDAYDLGGPAGGGRAPVAVDVGANVGDTAIEIFRTLENVRVLALAPAGGGHHISRRRGGPRGRTENLVQRQRHFEAPESGAFRRLIRASRELSQGRDIRR